MKSKEKDLYRPQEAKAMINMVLGESVKKNGDERAKEQQRRQKRETRRITNVGKIESKEENQYRPARSKRRKEIHWWLTV